MSSSPLSTVNYQLSTNLEPFIFRQAGRLVANRAAQAAENTDDRAGAVNRYALRALAPSEVGDDDILRGGEDYELLATFREGPLPAAWRLIGRVCAGEGVWTRARGEAQRLSPRGWDHFSAT